MTTREEKRQKLVDAISDVARATPETVTLRSLVLADAILAATEPERQWTHAERDAYFATLPGDAQVVAESCQWDKCAAPGAETRTDLGGTTFALCARHVALGDSRGFWRPGPKEAGTPSSAASPEMPDVWCNKRRNCCPRAYETEAEARSQRAFCDHVAVRYTPREPMLQRVEAIWRLLGGTTPETAEEAARRVMQRVAALESELEKCAAESAKAVAAYDNMTRALLRAPTSEE